MSDGEFSVWLFFPDDIQFAECRFVSVETAMKAAVAKIRSPANELGVLQKVMVTDGDDLCCFLYEAGLGVTFPPKNAKTGRFTDEHDPDAVWIGEAAKGRAHE